VNGTVRLVPSVPEAFADLVAAVLAKVTTPGYPLFLSGGGTALECYRALAARPGLPWDVVDVFVGDERCVPTDDPDANHRMISETLLDVVGPVHADHPMYRSGPPAAAATAYQDLVAGLPDLGLIHLGLGPDGHTASLFPGSPACSVTDPSLLVVDNVDPHGANPHERVTLTFAAIARAAHTVVTVSGTSKHRALARVMAGDDVPATRVTGPDVLWLVDADALGDLAADQVA